MSVWQHTPPESHAPGHVRGYRLRDLAHPHYTGWVRAGTALVALGYAGVIISSLIITGGPLSAHAGELGALAASLVALWLAHHDRVGTASAVLVVAVGSEMLVALVTAGSLRSSPTIALPALVMGVGLLLGGRAGFAFGGFISIAAPLATALGRSLGIATLSGSFADDMMVFVTFVPTVLATAGVVHLALRAMGSTLELARKSEAERIELLANAPDGILALDEDRCITWLNPAAGVILGTDARSLRGRKLAHALGRISEGDGTTVVERLLEHAPHLPLEFSLIRGTRDTFVEATAQHTVRDDGSVAYQIVLRDVTARRKAENQAGQLGRILEEALNEIFVIDPQVPHVVLASRGARENLGYDSVNLGGAAPANVNPALTAERLQQIRREVMRTDEGVLSNRGIHRRRDGSVYPVETRIQAAHLDGKTVLVVFAVDISERVKAEEEQRHLQQQLEHAQRMEAVGQLAGGVAHDFNNLLTVIGGYSELLLSSDDEDTRGMADEIRKAQERGAGLTRQLLAFARREVVQPQVLELAEVLPDTRPLLEGLLGAQLQLDIQVEGAPRIVGDRGQLEQILLNLAANARDAMPGGGEATLSARKVGQHVILEFSDAGAGMEPEVVQRAVEPFFTSKPRGQGTGLGLSTVHGIVTQNGGTLEIDSVVGRGTRVIIRWPATTLDASDEVPTSRVPSQPSGTGRILVVEDNDSARGLVTLVLERAGYSVVSAEHAERAEEELKRHEWAFDLLLTDVVMPGKSGIELAEDVRSMRPGLPILLMSGHLEDGVETIDGVDPARDLILKPFRTDELRSRVRRALARAGV